MNTANESQTARPSSALRAPSPAPASEGIPPSPALSAPPPHVGAYKEQTQTIEVTSLAQIIDLHNEPITAKIFAYGRLLQFKGRRRLPAEADETRNLLKQAIPPRNEKGRVRLRQCRKPNVGLAESKKPPKRDFLSKMREQYLGGGENKYA